MIRDWLWREFCPLLSRTRVVLSREWKLIRTRRPRTKDVPLPFFALPWLRLFLASVHLSSHLSWWARVNRVKAPAWHAARVRWPASYLLLMPRSFFIATLQRSISKCSSFLGCNISRYISRVFANFCIDLTELASTCCPEFERVTNFRVRRIPVSSRDNYFASS